MIAMTQKQPVKRQIIWLIATLVTGFALMVALYLAASAIIGQIDRRMYEYHDHAQTLALRLRNSLSAAHIPRGSVMGRDGVSVNDWRVFAGEAIRSYDEIFALEGEIRALHRDFEDPAVPDRTMARLARAIAELRSLRERHRSDRAGFAVALASSRPYLEIVAAQLLKYHGAERVSLQKHRRRIGTLFEMMGVALSLGIILGVWVLMRRNLRAVDALLEHGARQGDALLESEAKFSAAFRGSPDVMVINRTRDGKIVDVNPAYERFFGYRRDELIGRTTTELGVTANPLARQPFVDRLLRDGTIEEMPWQSRTRNGEVRDVLQSAYLIEIGGEQHHVAILHDLTERKQAEQALLEREAQLSRFKSALDQTLDCVFFFRQEDFRFIYVNEGAKRNVGYSEAELFSMTPLDIKPEYTLERFRQLVQPLVDGTQASRNFETVHRRKDGSDVSVEVFLQLVQEAGADRRFVAIVRDITERKRRQEFLRVSEERYRSVVTAMAEGVVLQDSDGTVLTFNERAHVLFGLRDDAAEGAAVIALAGRAIHENGAPFRDEELPSNEVRRTRKPCLGVTMGQKRTDGSLAWLSVSAVPVLGADGTSVVNVVTTFADFTERRLLDEELRVLNSGLELRVAKRTAELQQSNKDLESFSYSVSHDLRAPLRHVAGYVDLLRQSLADGMNDEAMRRMDVIAGAARRMGNLIDDLLSFSRIGRLGMTLEVVDADAVVRGALEDLQPETQGRDIDWHIAPLPGFIADRSLLRLVFMNLISNAVKFTHGRTPARIEVGCIERDKEFAEHVVFVKDNGAGFDMRYSEKLFGVFQRLHNASEFEGTGIGLANCQRIVERHGGRIWGEGIVNGGATFFFALPRKQPGGQE